MDLYQSLEQALEAEEVTETQVRTSRNWTFLAKGVSFQPQVDYESGKYDLKGAVQSAQEAIPPSDLEGVDFLVLHDYNWTHTINIAGSNRQEGKYFGKAHGVNLSDSVQRENTRTNKFAPPPTDSKGQTHHVDLNAVLIGYAINR